MSKKQLLFLGLIIVGASFLFIAAISKGSLNKQIPVLPVSNDIVLYYGDTCPHCHDLKNYMTENKIQDKIQITEKEVYNNKENSLELQSRALECKLPENQIAVPFLYAKGICYVGTDQIKNFYTEYLSQTNQSTESSGSNNK